MLNEFLTMNIEQLDEELEEIKVEVYGINKEINTIETQIDELRGLSAKLENKKIALEKLQESIVRIKHCKEDQ